MKINKEKFNKLKQLDRIEFRQKYDRIRNLDFSMNDVVWYILIITCISILGSLLSPLNEILINLVASMLVIFVVVIMLNIIAILFGFYYKSKKIKELQEEYFKVEVKK